MHADTERDDQLASRSALGVELCDRGPHRERGASGRVRAVGRIADRAERRHEPVTSELVDDPARVEHAARHHPQIRVHRRDRLLG